MTTINLLYYHYLDTMGIDSLFAQCEPMEMTKTTELGAEGSLAGEGKLEPGFLAAIPMLPKAELTAKTEGKVQRRRSTTYQVTIETRLSRLETYLRDAGQLWEYPGSTTEMPPRAAYALLQALFQISAAGVGEPGAKYWEFSADLPIGRVDMRTSVKRYRTSPTHLVEYWSTNAGEPANATLRVFGRLKMTGDGVWYLKPLAIADAG